MPKTSYLCKRQEKPKAKINNRETTSKTIAMQRSRTIAKQRNKKNNRDAKKQKQSRSNEIKKNNHKIMRAVIQRVTHASVTIDGNVKSKIGNGFLILLGVEATDSSEDVDWLVRKVAALRVFDDENGVMNRSLIDVDGEALVVSQFTLFASYKKGNRPSWLRAATHDISVPLYEEFCTKLSSALGKPVGTGEFGADMKVELLNDGPVTICMDTKNKE